MTLSIMAFLCGVSFILNSENKPYVLSVIMLSAVMLSVIMLSVIMLIVIVLNVVYAERHK